jgi:uncharacterized protein with NRDE domain
MCTVVYLPTANGLLVSSIRDEQFLRPAAMPPKQHPHHGKILLYPTDAQAGGTWMVADNDGKVTVLFNGAFEKHVANTPYRKSRGIVLLDIVSADEFTTAWQQYDLNGIEPFSMVHTDGHSLMRCTWDGIQKIVDVLDPLKSHIWSSATLYNTEQRSLRQEIFQEWLREQQHPISSNVLREFFKTTMPNDVANRFIMNRNNILGSVSFTICMMGPELTSMQYHSLVSGESFTEELVLQTSTIKPMQ